jgi:pantothenate kinase
LVIEALLSRAAEGEDLGADERACLARWLLAEPSQMDFFAVTGEEEAPVVVAERLRWLPATWRALADGLVVASGYQERIACTREAVFLFHLPLAQLLLRRAAEGAPRRQLVAVAGLPAGGKSIFTAILVPVLEALGPPFGIVALGLDGYHFPNAYLLARPAPPGVPEPGSLSLYKGGPFTFDAARLAADLRRLRETADPVALPAYDRTLHEPVDGRVLVQPSDRLVLVEGNYLLCRDDGWADVADRFDLRIFLDLPAGLNREPMIARHMRGGRTREDAERHYERSDRRNTELVAATRDEADILVELDGSYAPRRVRGRAAGKRFGIP